jgi:hypothetical protein
MHEHVRRAICGVSHEVWIAIAQLASASVWPSAKLIVALENASTAANRIAPSTCVNDLKSTLQGMRRVFACHKNTMQGHDAAH